MALLTREQFLKLDDAQYTFVDVPEWGNGAQMRVKSLSLAEQMQCDKLEDQDASGRAIQVIFFGCVNEDGSQFFTDNADIKYLQTKNSNVVLKLFKAICELSNPKKEQIEQQAKNS